MISFGFEIGLKKIGFGLDLAGPVYSVSDLKFKIQFGFEPNSYSNGYRDFFT